MEDIEEPEPERGFVGLWENDMARTLRLAQGASR
jgi:hypothetical protein